ncbi:MAG: hypothetical protein ETSY1_18980 [Candidatus Entotheonella factor]|uniref:Fungal lipase-type domain-containing protein n=1 Tax=Entotheonella factor TaxID=1429438 RepID=W4LK89_ENTF1|nr:lipase family protein [Candidatus Entotheonella palauensis]ETW98387.1 MAG: hypothetical protein ETSY1_18980 [Candidatus Entotheonella factor]
MIQEGQIYLKGKHRPIPISVLTDEEAVYSARRADGSPFDAKVNVVTGDCGSRTQEELIQARKPRKSIASKKACNQLQKASEQLSATSIEEIDDMFLTWDPTALNRTDPMNVAFGFEMAALAYVDPIGKLQKILEQPGVDYKEVRSFDAQKTDTQSFIAVTPDEKGIVIAFRGTTPGKDILTDLSVSFDDCLLGGQAHEGFQNYVTGAKRLMYEHLEKVMLMYPDAKIFGAGHSLGAAAINNFMATAIGDRVIRADQVGRVVLAGCPRGFDRKAARLFNHQLKMKVDRCVNGSDIVTKVPALISSAIASLLALFQRDAHPGFYKHIGASAPNVFFDHRGIVKSKEPMLYRIWDRLTNLKGQAIDHYLGNYLKCAYQWANDKGRLPTQTVGQCVASRVEKVGV